MLSLAQLNAKKAETGSKRKEKIPAPDEDPEWIQFREVVRCSSLKESISFLISEFTKKSKEHGKCVEYLKMIIVKTCDQMRQVNREEIEKCVAVMYQALFELAQLSWSIPTPIIEDMISQGMNAIRNYPSSVISSLISKYCIKQLNQHTTINFSSTWIEMFERFMSVLNEKGDIPHESDIIRGANFREHVVEELCRMDWSEKVVISILTILDEMPGLCGYEVDIIMEKFNASLKTLYAGAIHSSMTQIVNIAGHLRPAVLLRNFDNYFMNNSKTVEEKTAPSKKAGKRNVAQKRVSLGTVAFNFVEASRHCEPMVKEVIKRVKASVYDHTLVTAPFTLSVALGMTSVDYLRISIIDPLKTSIIRSFHELNLSQASKWYRDTRGDVPDEITQCFKTVLNDSTSSLEYMSEGLKELGISLLNIDNLQWKFPMTSKKCRELGSYLIQTVVLHSKEQLAVLSKELLKPDSPAHIECLASCLSQSSRALTSRDFHGRISELMQHLPSMTVESASVLVKSLMPALQISPILLDDIMIVLRKTFWKSAVAGRICVEVMCVILSNSFVIGNSQLNSVMGIEGDENDLIFSQCTQGNARSASGNDYSSLCHEILNLAKRFYLLDCKVREQLYLGLHRVSRRNPILNDVISGQLFAHAEQFMPANQTEVNFKSLFEFPATNLNTVYLKDELGFLIQCIGFVFNKSHSVMDHSNEPASYINCKNILSKWISFACDVDSNMLEISASDIVGSLETPRPLEVVRFVKDLSVMQTMQVIEALIEFLSLAEGWPQAKQKTSKLFRKYQELEKYNKEQGTAKKGKGADKTKGKKRAKKADETGNGSDVENTSVVSGSDNLNPPLSKLRKLEVLHKPVYFHLINLDSICKMLRELYGPENTSISLKSLRGQDDFEIMLLLTVKEKVGKLKLKESLRERQRAPIDISNALTFIAEMIWKRLCRMEEIKNGDDRGEERLFESTNMVQVRLEVIADILELFSIGGHKNRLLYFSNYCARDRDLTQCALQLFEEWKRVLDLVTTEFDGLSNSGNPHLFTILNLVCKAMVHNHTLDKIHTWCWQYLKDADTDPADKVGTKELLETAVTLFINCNTKCSTYSIKSAHDVLKLAKGVRKVLGDVEEEEFELGQASWLIKQETVPTLLCCITNYIESQLDMLSSILGRLKAHKQYLGTERSVGMREKCFRMINSLLLIATELVRSAFPSGPCATQMVKVITHLYCVLSNFAEHLFDVNKVKTDQNCSLTSFKTLVAELGKHFKPRIESMIHHMELAQRIKINEQTGKVSAAMKFQLAKDARLIPNMIYNIEKFEQIVIKLSKKVKLDMLCGLKLSTARDFRVEAGKFKEALEERNKNAPKRKKPVKKATVNDALDADAESDASMQDRGQSSSSGAVKKKVTLSKQQKERRKRKEK